MGRADEEEEVRGEEGGVGFSFSSRLALENCLGARLGCLALLVGRLWGFSGFSSTGSCLMGMRAMARVPVHLLLPRCFAMDCSEAPTKSQRLQAKGIFSGCWERMWTFKLVEQENLLPHV